MQPGPGTLFPRSGPSVSNSYAHPQPPMRGNVHLYDALARAQEMQSSQQVPRCPSTPPPPPPLVIYVEIPTPLYSVNFDML